MQIQGHQSGHQEARLQREARCDGGLPDRRTRDYRTRLDVPRHQAPDKEAARGMDDYGRPVLLLRGTEPHLFRQRLAQTLN